MRIRRKRHPHNPAVTLCWPLGHVQGIYCSISGQNSPVLSPLIDAVTCGISRRANALLIASMKAIKGEWHTSWVCRVSPTPRPFSRRRSAREITTARSQPPLWQNSAVFPLSLQLRYRVLTESSAFVAFRRRLSAFLRETDIAPFDGICGVLKKEEI